MPFLCIFIQAALFFMSAPSQAQEVYTGGYAKMPQYSDQFFENKTSEDRRKLLIEWHKNLVDQFNNLANKIATVESLDPKKHKKVNLPIITVYEKAPSGAITKRKINGLNEVKNALSRSHLLGTLKTRYLSKEDLDAVVENLEEIQTWLDKTDLAYFSEFGKGLVEKIQIGNCPATAEKHDSKPLDPKWFEQCLNAQKVGVEGSILTYDGLKPVDQPTTVTARAAMPLTPQPTPTSSKAPIRINMSSQDLANTSDNSSDGKPSDRDVVIRVTDDLKSADADPTNKKGNQHKKDKVSGPKFKLIAKNSLGKKFKKPTKRKVSKKKLEQRKKALDNLKTRTAKNPINKPAVRVSKTTLSKSAKDALRDFKKSQNTGEIPSGLGRFLIDSEVSIHPNKALSQSQVDAWNKSWTDNLEKYKKLIAKMDKSTNDEKIQAIALEMHKDYLGSYCANNAQILDFLDSGCANCDGETKMLLSVYGELGLKPDNGKTFGIQVFGHGNTGTVVGHVQAVIYDPDPAKDTVWNLLTGGAPKKGRIADIYDPHLLYQGYLKKLQIKQPVTTQDLLIAKRNLNENLPQDKVANSFSEKDLKVNTNIEYPESDAVFMPGQESNLPPEFASLAPPADANVSVAKSTRTSIGGLAGFFESQGSGPPAGVLSVTPDSPNKNQNIGQLIVWGDSFSNLESNSLPQTVKSDLRDRIRDYNETNRLYDSFTVFTPNSKTQQVYWFKRKQDAETFSQLFGGDILLADEFLTKIRFEENHNALQAMNTDSAVELLSDPLKLSKATEKEIAELYDIMQEADRHLYATTHFFDKIGKRSTILKSMKQHPNILRLYEAHQLLQKDFQTNPGDYIELLDQNSPSFTETFNYLLGRPNELNPEFNIGNALLPMLQDQKQLWLGIDLTYPQDSDQKKAIVPETTLDQASSDKSNVAIKLNIDSKQNSQEAEHLVSPALYLQLLTVSRSQLDDNAIDAILGKVLDTPGFEEELLKTSNEFYLQDTLEPLYSPLFYETNISEEVRQCFYPGCNCDCLNKNQFRLLILAMKADSRTANGCTRSIRSNDGSCNNAYFIDYTKLEEHRATLLKELEFDLANPKPHISPTPQSTDSPRPTPVPSK